MTFIESHIGAANGPEEKTGQLSARTGIVSEI